MKPYLVIFHHLVPSYGAMILIGMILANLIGVFLLSRKYQADINDFIVCEGYLILGAIIGSKLLYLWVSRKNIIWENMTDIVYFNSLMRGGFVFYGGLLGGLFCLYLCGWLHKIEITFYIRKLGFLIPFIHGFGRIGCFLSGCCYGKPYDGIAAVRFPEGSFAPAGINLFPVQLAEAVLLFLLSLVLFFVSLDKRRETKGLFYYLAGYGVMRFFLEFLRFDTRERGYMLFLSTSQWISLFIVVIAVSYECYRTIRARSA